MNANQEKKYVLINAIYDVDMYAHTMNEYEEKGYITWETRLVEMRPGDVIYIYYSKLPMESEGRVLLRGEVLESNIKLTCDEIYGNKDMTIVKAIKIANVEAVAYADTEKYSKDTLQSKYGIITTRGGIYLKNEHRSFIDFIEANVDDRSSVQESLIYFKKCVDIYNEKTFCECGKKHVTFLKTDGTKYFEKHHLIPLNTIDKLGLPEKFVDSEDNKFHLCSNCHNEIHYGCIDRRRSLIKTLYLLKSDWYDEKFGAYAEPMGVLDWLYKLYRVEKSK